jgi:hypothetical protein
MLKEFKEFALRGNVMDVAVGIIIAPHRQIARGTTSSCRRSASSPAALTSAALSFR